MENPEDLVRTLEGQVERLKVIFNEATSALTDDVSEVSQFCVSLECCLRHNQREKLSFWGDRRDYWNYLSEGVGRMKSLETIVKRVQTLAHLSTSQGRGRGLIRECLEQHVLGDLVQTSVSNLKRTKEWYHSTSVLLSPVHSQRLISALYDLTDVDFDLPSEGVDLDETWPSFVLKSFQRSDVRRSAFVSPAGSTKEAITASSASSSHRVTLERGIEEEASEIYVKQEIPFSISLVSSLLDDIRCNLVGQSETIGGHTHLCPDLEVTKLDDVTSCLTVLRDYITAWSCDVTKNSHSLQEEVRQARVQMADMEMQLQETMKESEGVETSLLNQLQDTRDDLQLCSNQIQELFDDNLTLKSSLSHGRAKMSELEALNFSLEEMLMEAQEGEGEGEEGGEGEGEGEEVDGGREERRGREEVDGGREERRGRSATLIETALKEKDEAVEDLSQQLHEREKQLRLTKEELATSQDTLNQVSSELSALQEQVETEAEEKAAVSSTLAHLQEKAESLEREVERLTEECGVARDEATGLKYQLSSTNMELQLTKATNEDLSQQLHEREKQLHLTKEELATSQNTLNQVSSELSSLQEQENCAGELEDLRRRVRELDEVEEKAESLEREVERLTEECGVARDEATGLKYQLSSTNMELQLTKELLAEKEGSLSSLISKSTEKEQQLRETREREQLARGEAEGLRYELRELEREVGNQSSEMSLLCEQLTEKTYSRDKERAELLRAQTSLDVLQSQLETEKQGYAKEVVRLTEENNDIRRAFRRLLEQKVTLWQHADELEQEQQQLGKWINSKTVTACMECAVTFTLRVRKHHCRSCGRVCCARCCDQKSQLPFSREPVRVCEKCHERIIQMRTPFVSQFINSSEGGSDPQQGGTPPSSSSTVGSWRNSSANSLNIERSLDTAGNSLHAKLRVQNDDSSVSSSYDGKWMNSSPPPPGGSARSLEGSGNFDSTPGNNLRPHSSASRLETIGGETTGGHSWSPLDHDEYSVDPEVRKRENVRSSGRQSGVEEVTYHMTAVEGDSLEDSYYLIDTNPQFPVGVDVPGNKYLDVNALASKLASLEVRQHGGSGAPGGENSDPLQGATGGGGISREGLTGFTEVALEGGSAHSVKVKVEKKGTAVAWEFMSEPKGLAFSLSFEEVEGAKTEQILPLRRCVSHKATLSAEYVAQKVGNYILRFDNCHSKYSGRRLRYRQWVRLPT